MTQAKTDNGFTAYELDRINCDLDYQYTLDIIDGAFDPFFMTVPSAATNTKQENDMAEVADAYTIRKDDLEVIGEIALITGASPQIQGGDNAAVIYADEDGDLICAFYPKVGVLEVSEDNAFKRGCKTAYAVVGLAYYNEMTVEYC